jgi:hypothetical protein
MSSKLMLVHEHQLMVLNVIMEITFQSIYSACSPWYCFSLHGFRGYSSERRHGMRYTLEEAGKEVYFAYKVLIKKY